MSDVAAVQGGEWTLSRLLGWTTDCFARRSIEDPRLAAEVLLAHAAGCARIDLYTRFDQPLAAGPLERFRELVRRAMEREPIAYLVGEREFFSLRFAVNRSVLVPRPETESLVEAALSVAGKMAWEAPCILDMGTGSGCVAVAIAKHYVGARVTATDICPEALETARRNAERHGVEQRLTFRRVDRLRMAADDVPEGGFHMLVSNPPYIAPGELDGLDPGVRSFEPRLALTDEGDGLSFYRSFSREAAGLLVVEGAVIVEVAEGRAATVVRLLEEGGGLRHESTVRDRVLGHERVVVMRRQGGAL